MKSRRRRTPKQRVLKKEPNAFLYRRSGNGHYAVMKWWGEPTWRRLWVALSTSYCKTPAQAWANADSAMRAMPESRSFLRA